ncbi:PspC domain-containing protein [Pseudonocardia endophytica]|uniref:Phage shock protein C (PspC) family protein n=1 Tax=Pseudonocardia endophytica TaxID=401976 RepID=A0A4R1HLD0_PSEEN|nr:PspC domain-containing protein [Pseudonocardia endophytica]TCK20409.1 phage shock protein C (PspC) family protein [Pseudonocardia endophytica]
MEETARRRTARLSDAWATRPARPREGRMVAGVAAALGERYDIDPVLVRVGFATAAFFGPGIPLYLVGCAVLPDAGSAGSGRSRTALSTVLLVGAAVIVAALMFGGDGGWVAPLMVSVGLLALLHITRGGPREVTASGSAGAPGPGSAGAVAASGTGATTATAPAPVRASGTPFSDAPVSRAPASDAPASAVPASSAPASDAPASDAPDVAGSAPDAPATDDAPTVATPIADAAVSGTATTDHVAGPDAHTVTGRLPADGTAPTGTAPTDTAATGAAATGAADTAAPGTGAPGTGAIGASTTSAPVPDPHASGRITGHGTAPYPVATNGSDPAATPPSWDPLGAAPFAWDLPDLAPEQGPEPPPARRSRVTAVTLAVALLATGGTGAAALTVPGVVAPAMVPAAALAVIGLGLVIGAFRHAGRWLLPFAALLAVTTWLVAALPWADLRGGVGTIADAPTSATAVAPEYRRGVGDVALDLSGLDLRTPPGAPAPVVRTAARVGIGSIAVTVPRDADIVVRGSSSFGDVTVDGQSRSGDAPELTVVDVGPDGPGGGRIELDAHAALGSVTVGRE